MSGVIFGDVRRVFSQLKTWLFILGIIFVFIVNSYFVSHNYYAANSVSYANLPVLYGMTSVATLSMLYVFGLPLICGDIVAHDRQTKYWDLIRVRGVKNSRIFLGHVIALLLIAGIVAAIVFLLSSIGSIPFFNGRAAASYSSQQLAKMTVMYMPSIAENSIFLYWLFIGSIYVLLAWGVLSFSLIIGVISELPTASMIVPAAFFLLMNELIFDLYTQRQFCYMNLQIPATKALSWSETTVQTVQLPITIAIFIAVAFLSLYAKNRGD